MRRQILLFIPFVHVISNPVGLSALPEHRETNGAKREDQINDVTHVVKRNVIK